MAVLPAEVDLDAVEAEPAFLPVDMFGGRDALGFAVAAEAGLVELATLGPPFCLVGVACLLTFVGEADCLDADDVLGPDEAEFSWDTGWNGEPLRS